MTFARSVTAALLSMPVLVTSVGGPAHAQQVPLIREYRIGVLAHDVPGLWSGFRLERGIDANLELILSPSIDFLGGSIRPAIGGSFNFSGGTSKAYLDARWMYEGPSGWFVGLGIGAAVHDGVLDPTEVDRKALGRRVLFHFPLEVGYRVGGHHSVSLYFDHMSNAYTTKYNEGLDTLGVRYGYKF